MQVKAQLLHPLLLSLPLPIVLFLNHPLLLLQALLLLLLLLLLLPLLLKSLDRLHLNHLLLLLLLLSPQPQLMLVLVQTLALEFLLHLNPQPLVLDHPLLANVASLESTPMSRSTLVARSNPVLNFTHLFLILSLFFSSCLLFFKQQTFNCSLEAELICHRHVDI